MSNDNQDPKAILVNANPAQENIEALVRALVMAASAIASALGYVGVAGKFSSLLVAVGPIAWAITLLIGQLKTFKLAHAALPSTTNVATKEGWLKKL